MDVKALVTQAQNGNVQAFEQLVLLYQDRLYGLCHRLAGNHTDAQDLAQEAFVRAYRALGKFRQEADFGTYLHRIAVNLWLSYRKRNHNEFSLDDPVLTTEGELLRQVADNNQQPEQVLENAEFQLLVREALAVLPKEHRAVLVLREMESLSYEEIAATLGVAPGTVKSRLNRARNALKKTLRRMAAKKGFELPVTE
ncbi:MAG: sigma-70 family RNA polymerase sigma factor [Thermoanaerobacteraceae bacterium]|nr:sigma-70 family RNA polymerase sigma factor [Thermoanaerobacteraceae bacterium]